MSVVVRLYRILYSITKQYRKMTLTIMNIMFKLRQYHPLSSPNDISFEQGVLKQHFTKKQTLKKI